MQQFVASYMWTGKKMLHKMITLVLLYRSNFEKLSLLLFVIQVLVIFLILLNTTSWLDNLDSKNLPLQKLLEVLIESLSHIPLLLCSELVF